jgi:hypothetical protein
MLPRDALDALRLIHVEGSRDAVDGWPVACCMVCREDGWPCTTRRIIDEALDATGDDR